MNEKALHTLEYDKIIQKLVGYAVSPMAKERRMYIILSHIQCSTIPISSGSATATPSLV